MYPRQYAAICDPARIVIIEASTKSGKTAGCLLWLLAQAWNATRAGAYWWIAPTFHVTKTVGYARLRAMLTESDPRQITWTPHDADLAVSLVNGSRIWFRSADNHDSLFGDDVSAAVIDEATRCPEAAWNAVRSTLTATRGPCRIIGNVKGRKNWVWRLARLAESGTAGMAFHRLTAYDAVAGGILPADEIEEARAVLPAHVFRELYLAEPADDGSNPFGTDAIARCVGDLSPGPAVAYGVDLAKSHDWTAVVGLDAGGRVCVAERWQSDWGRDARTCRADDRTDARVRRFDGRWRPHRGGYRARMPGRGRVQILRAVQATIDGRNGVRHPSRRNPIPRRLATA